MVALRSRSMTRAENFVNEVSDELHLLTGIKQRVTNACNPQSNGLFERQNRTLKHSLVLKGNPLKQLSIIEEVLFAHQFSTKYCRFKLLYNWQPVLPIDVKYKLSSTEKTDPDEPFDKNIFDAVLTSSNVIREEVHTQAGENIKKVQKKQQHDYESRNKSSALNDISFGAEVFLRNNKRKDWKSGKFTFKWLGPYVVSDITRKGLVTLKKENDKGFKKK